MQRVAVVGCIGSGKSTVARALGKALGIEVFHLDSLWWQPGRYRITGPATVASRTMEPGQFRKVEMTITAGSSWIIDGDATNKDVRLSRGRRRRVPRPASLALRLAGAEAPRPRESRVPPWRARKHQVDTRPAALDLDDLAVQTTAVVGPCHR